MGSFLRYFRQHPWYCRALTASMALTVGALTAVLLYPHIRYRLLIHNLAAEDAGRRMRAIHRLRDMASTSQVSPRRLERDLETDNDRRFAAIAAVLKSLDRFYVPAREPLKIDRLNAIELDEETAAQARWMTMAEIVLSGRDNRYIRRGLVIGAADSSSSVRRLATMLAARLGDDDALEKLLHDDDSEVAAAAALSAAAGRREALGESLAGLLAQMRDVETISAAAYALAIVQPGQSSQRICGLLEGARDPALRDRLLHVLALLADARARQTVFHVLARTRQAGRYPRPMALLAAGKEVEYYAYEGQGHAFQGESWELFMERITAFFDVHLSEEG